MTNLSKFPRTCPLCNFRDVKNLPHHLHVRHDIQAGLERRRLIKQAKFSSATPQKIQYGRGQPVRDVETEVDHISQESPHPVESVRNNLPTLRKFSGLTHEAKKWHIRKYATDEFIRFLREIISNVKQDVVSCDKERLCALDCRYALERLVSRDVDAAQARKFLSSDKVLRALDCMIFHVIRHLSK